MKNIKHIVLASIIGASLLAASVSSSALSIRQYRSAPAPDFMCRYKDEVCKQNLSESQKQAIADWRTEEHARRAAYNESVARAYAQWNEMQRKVMEQMEARQAAYDAAKREAEQQK